MKDLYEAYLRGDPELGTFFGKMPHDLLRVKPERAGLDAELVGAVSRYQDHIGGGGTVTGDDAVIVTGQQPGLFTGPLYTIYKAVTAILLARRLSQEHRVRCVPVFWVASSDHDLEEAGVAHLLTRHHEILTLRYTPSADVADAPMNKVPLEPELHEFIDRAAAEARGGDKAEEVATFLHSSLDASQSLAEWTTRILARLFKGTPLVLFAPELPEVRRRARAVLGTELKNPTNTSRAVNEAGRRLEDLGYSAQVRKSETDCSFFLELDGRRRKVVYEGDLFILPQENRRITRMEMQDLLDNHPEWFSENVALRPVVQQHVLRPVAYVGGPGETAYWAQLRGVFRDHGLDMPVLYPRARCVLTTVKLNKLLQKTGLTISDLFMPLDQLVDRALSVQGAGAAVELIRAHRPRLMEALVEFQSALSAHGDPAKPMARAVMEHVGRELDRMERSLLRADRQRVETIEKQVRRLCTALAPWRKPQERVYTVVSFLFEHGWDLIPRLMGEVDVFSFGLNEVEL